MKRIMEEMLLALAGILVIVLFAAIAFAYSLPELEPEHKLELPPEEKRALHSMDKHIQMEPVYLAGIGPVLEDMPELEPAETVITQSRYSDWNVEYFRRIDKPDQNDTEVVCQIGNHKFAREVK